MIACVLVLNLYKSCSTKEILIVTWLSTLWLHFDLILIIFVSAKYRVVEQEIKLAWPKGEEKNVELCVWQVILGMLIFVKSQTASRIIFVILQVHGTAPTING